MEQVKDWKACIQKYVAAGAVSYRVTGSERRLEYPGGVVALTLPTDDTDASLTRYALEQMAWHEYRKAEGRVMPVSWLVGCAQGTGATRDVAFKHPIRVRVLPGAKAEDIERWGDDEHLDPVWRVEPVEPNIPELAGLRSLLVYATSRSVDGLVSEGGIVQPDVNAAMADDAMAAAIDDVLVSGTLPVTVYTEVYTESEAPGPRWAKFVLDRAMLERIALGLDLCREHDLASVSFHAWPEKWEASESRMDTSKLAVADGHFWFEGQTKGDTDVQTLSLPVIELCQVVLAGESSQYPEGRREGCVVYWGGGVDEVLDEYPEDAQDA